VYHAALPQPALDGSRNPPIFRHAARAREQSAIEHERERGVTELEGGAQRCLVHRYARFGREARDAQPVAAHEVVVLAGPTADDKSDERHERDDSRDTHRL
jgi:hypothetical protein